MTVRPIEVGHETIGLRTGHRYREKSRPFFWPLAGDYPIYDRYLYTVMTADDERAIAYHAAIENIAAGKTVVEIGTGDQAHWARACAKAGAKKVYAIEENLEALKKASTLIEEEGLTNKISLLHGTSTRLELPERVDLSVSEIIGEIGSSEGVIAILNDVRQRFLKPEAKCVPQKCDTYCVPFELPDGMENEPIVEKLGASYVRKIFDLADSPFDLRLTLDNCFEEIPRQMLAPPKIVESMDFTKICEESEIQTMSFDVEKEGRFNGLLLWIELYAGDRVTPLSSLTRGSNWRPVFCPLFDPGLPLIAGSRIEVRWSRLTSSDGMHPDYHIECTVKSLQNSWESKLRWPHLGGPESFRQNGLYSRLFPRVDAVCDEISLPR